MLANTRYSFWIACLYAGKCPFELHLKTFLKNTWVPRLKFVFWGYVLINILLESRRAQNFLVMTTLVAWFKKISFLKCVVEFLSCQKMQFHLNFILAAFLLYIILPVISKKVRKYYCFLAQLTGYWLWTTHGTSSVSDSYKPTKIP